MEKNFFLCDQCPKVFSTKRDLEIHLKRHTGESCEVFSCDQCPKAFSTKKDLENHLRRHTCESCEVFSCDQCPKVFSLKNDLEKHVRKHTGESEPFSKEKLKNLDPKDFPFIKISWVSGIKLSGKFTKESGMILFSCNKCLKAISEQSNLKRHLVTHNSKNTVVDKKIKYEEVNTVKHIQCKIFQVFLKENTKIDPPCKYSIFYFYILLLYLFFS